MGRRPNGIDYLREAELEAATSEAELQNVFSYEPTDEAGEVEATLQPELPLSPELPIAEWMQRALANLRVGRNDPATFWVLKRTLETASRFQVADYPKPDGGDFEQKFEELRLFIEKAIASLKTDQPIFTMTEGGFSAEVGAQKMAELDEEVFRITKAIEGDLPWEVSNEHRYHNNFADICVEFGIVLYKYFGDEVLDLSYELIKFGSSWSVRYGLNESPFQKAVAETKDEGNKKEVVEATSRLHKLKTGREILIVGWMLCSEGWIVRKDILERNPEDTIRELKERFLNEPGFRIALLTKIQRLVRMPDTFIIRAFTRRGLFTLMEEAEEVTDHEWWMRLRNQWGELEVLTGNERKEFLDGEEAELKHRDLKGEIDDFFEKHPEAPKARKLAEVIGCDALREELLKVRMEHNSSRLRLKIREIIMKILTEVARYRYRTNHLSEKNSPPTWQLGLPLYVTREKMMSCFSGPWLTAALLLKCGFSYGDLAYCHVYEADGGIVGGHGALLLNDPEGNYFLIDPNFHPECYELHERIFQSMDPKISVKIMELLHGTRKRPVRLKLPPFSEVPELHMLGIHPHMMLMPLTDGLTSGHMLNVGISFLIEGKLDEAKIAFEFGLCAFSKDPDLYYYLGVVHMKKGEYEEAEAYFQRALMILPKHLKSQFALGELAMRQGNIMGAKIAFSPVHSGRDTIWRGDFFHTAATRTLQMPSWQLQELGFEGWERLLTEESREG